MNIVLTGFMGTGKTATGRLLSKKLGWKFVDTDELIVQDAKMSVADIFAKKGEPYFREIETKAVKRAAGMENVIISCGGGVVLKSENMDALEKTGKIVCLWARPEKILEFTSREGGRPLLKVENPLEKIKELLNKRAPYYKRCHVSIDTSDLSIEQVAEKILTVLEL